MIGEGRRIPEFIDEIAAAAEEAGRREHRGSCCEQARAEGEDVIDFSQLATPRRGGQARAVRRRRPGGAPLLRRRQGAPGAARRHRSALRARLRAGGRADVAPRGRRRTTSGWPRTGSCSAGSTSTCTRGDRKYNHAAQFTLVPGVLGRQLPEGVLVCNFSRGLMELDHVVTLFHEFGHLMHHVLAGRHEWVRFSGVATEWDFVEAPSQMLEEWAWDAGVLRSFATDAEGEPIPEDLVLRMRAADEFGKGFLTRTQMAYAAISYWFHQDRPADLTARLGELFKRYGLVEQLPDTHFHSRLRASRRLRLGLLHLRLVAGDREGPVHRLRPRRPVRDRGRAPLPRHGAGAGRLEGRRRPGRPTSSAAPTTTARSGLAGARPGARESR